MKYKNYKASIEYLYSLERIGIKYDLKNINEILDFISHPEKKFKSIHIAGTNGKGSVASSIKSLLKESGYKTGLYTSPHIKDFRERILINGRMISREYIIDFTNKMYQLFERIKPSFFEATTAMAFNYFADNNVEYAVIEAGLGGRLDSTNVINPIITVITGISTDHTEYLGNTIERITNEKAGIIKKNIPCVIGKMGLKSRNIIIKKCKEKKSENINADKLWEVNILNSNEEMMKLEVVESQEKRNRIKIEYPLIGKYQISNIKTVFATLDILGKSEGIMFSEDNIIKGFKNLTKNSKFYGRFQKICENPKIIIDVSHNEQGIKNIRENLKFFKYKKLFIIFGMMKDKEYEKCMKELERLNAKVILTKPNYKRAEEPEILFKSVKEKKNFYVTENINTAFKNVKKMLGKNDLVLVIGSFFLVSDFLKIHKFRL